MIELYMVKVSTNRRGFRELGPFVSFVRAEDLALELRGQVIALQYEFSDSELVVDHSAGEEPDGVRLYDGDPSFTETCKGSDDGEN